MAPDDALAIVVVTHDSVDHLRELADTLLPQVRDGDGVILVDSASSDGTATCARAISDKWSVIEPGSNGGFAYACHFGVRATRQPLILLLNPDCKVEPGCLDRLRAAAEERPEWDAWQAAVMLPDGRINTSGGIVHYLGIGWAGNCDLPASALPTGPQEVGFASGAALVIRRMAWDTLNGLDPTYFMYGEDLDLSLRMWLSGGAVGVIPDARVVHGYTFDKGARKWFWLERNRWRTVLSVYPAPLLLALAPALLGAELMLLAIAARDGWLVSKLRAQAAVVGELPTIVRRRGSVQARRRVSVTQFAAHLSASLDSPYVSISTGGWPARAQAAYWRLVRRLIA